jgi:hypothetical protein
MNKFYTDLCCKLWIRHFPPLSLRWEPLFTRWHRCSCVFIYQWDLILAYRKYKVLATLKFEQIMGKICVTFIAWKGIILLALKGNNTCKTYNFPIFGYPVYTLSFIFPKTFKLFGFLIFWPDEGFSRNALNLISTFLLESK